MRAEPNELEKACGRLRNRQAQRRFCIRQQVRLNNALGAFARWQLGWSLGLPESERERIRKRADALVGALRNGEAVPVELAADAEMISAHVEDVKLSLAPFDATRAVMEKHMKALARETPGAAFAESVRGFGLLGLAVVVGEAGNLSDYPNPAKLWKRLGWAPPDEYPQGEKSTGRKIPRARKGELYGVVVEPLMKQNGQGRYKALYDARKAVYLERFEAEGGRTPKAHAHRLAMRVMLKCLLADLWAAWNGQKNREAQ